MKASHAAPATALAMEFLVLTATRSGETRLATWDEVDLDAAVWTVPPGRMKQKRANTECHVVRPDDRDFARSRTATATAPG